MDQKIDRLYPSATFKNKKSDLEQRLEKNLNDVNNLTTISITLNNWLPTSKTKTTNQKRNKK